LLNRNYNDDLFASIYDNCPFWSSHFANTLLNQIEYKKNTIALDVGTGTGFPSIEIAERLGSTSTVYAVDTWDAALKRAKIKAEQLDVKNVVFQNESVLNLTFNNNMFDLITSNNCLNNVSEYTKALKECYRVLKPGGKLVQVFNLPDSLKEFYNIFRILLEEKEMKKEIALLELHIFEKRKTTKFTQEATEKQGYKILNASENYFMWPFFNGTCFLNYSFVKLAFLSSWQDIVPKEQLGTFWLELENRLNIYSQENNGFKLKIPYSCVVAEKLT